MISGLDHINIETTNLERSVDFYQRILGLKSGWRPSFDVPGAWLYVDEQPIIHLVERSPSRTGHTGPIHHVAIIAKGLDQLKQRLDSEGLKYSVTTVPDLEVTQVFAEDPDGVLLEFNFYASGE